METYSNFNELVVANVDAGVLTDNAMFIGKSDPWNRFEVEKGKADINALEDDVLEEAQNLRLPTDDAKIRQRIDDALTSMIDKRKDKYADIKKELLDLGVETLSDIVQYDEHFEEKFGGQT